MYPEWAANWAGSTYPFGLGFLGWAGLGAVGQSLQHGLRGAVGAVLLEQ